MLKMEKKDQRGNLEIENYLLLLLIVYRIYHLATLPRNDWKRLRTDKKPQLVWHTNSYSPEDNGIPEDSTTDVRK